jgi:hypothetical protein
VPFTVVSVQLSAALRISDLGFGIAEFNPQSPTADGWKLPTERLPVVNVSRAGSWLLH